MIVYMKDVRFKVGVKRRGRDYMLGLFPQTVMNQNGSYRK